MKKFIAIISVIAAVVAGFVAAANMGTFRSPDHKTDVNIDGFQEYKTLVDHYTNSDSNINISGTINVYDTDEKQSLKESSRFQFMRSGANTFYKINYLQIISDGVMSVQLDTVNKFLILSIDSFKKSAASISALSPMQKLLEDTSQFKIKMFVTSNDKRRTLEIHSDFNPEIKSAAITYNSKTYKIEAAEILWWKDAYYSDDKDAGYWLSKITYLYTEPSYFNAKSLLTNIVKINNGEATPVGRYKDYEIIIAN